MMAFAFKPFQAQHILLLQNWLKQPHVAEFWQETDNEEELKQKFLHKLHERDVRPYIVELNGRPIGYIQDYEACKVGGGWWPDVEAGVFGIDQFIGEPELVNRGIGTAMIREFVVGLFTNKAVRQIIIDPDPKNQRAIRAYEKVGFKKEKIIKTPGGAALLMSLTREDLRD